MTAALLAGVNPIQGLYASFAGPIAGGLTARSRIIVITTTSAAALAAESALRNLSASQRPAGIALLTLLTSAALAVAAALRFGRFTRFVTHSVMIGFLTGIIVNIICGQLATIGGETAPGPTAITRALYFITHPGEINIASLLSGLVALAVLVALARTRLASWAPLIALVIPTAIVALAGASSVARVTSLGKIIPGIPEPSLPQFSLLSYGMISGAGAIAAIIIVQGVGVNQSMLGEASGSPDSNRDIAAQGAGNALSALFRGLPVGGSLGQTLLNVRSGARTRWASVWSGAWMLAILAVFSGVVGLIALPALAATLVFLAASSLQIGELITIARTGPSSLIAVITTFIATLTLPVAAAVGIGVAVTLMQQLNRDALDLHIVELLPLKDGRLAEAEPPAVLPSRSVTVLDVYGSLLYAGSRTLERKLPQPGPAESPVVVLRMRGRTSVGATFVKVVADYAARLKAADGRLYLSGVDANLGRQLRRTGRIAGPVKIFEAEPIIGQSTYSAYLDAQAWLVSHEVPGSRSSDNDGAHGRSGGGPQPQGRDDADQ